MTVEVKMYSYEAHLIDDFKSQISKENPVFKFNSIAFEFNYINGRTDIIAKKGDDCLIAFEAKLKKWKKALNQAYRNTSFAHYSYVILPVVNISNALKNSFEFTKRGVGLCSISSEGISIEIEAKKNKPLLPWLTENAICYIEEDSNECFM